MLGTKRRTCARIRCFRGPHLLLVFLAVGLTLPPPVEAQDAYADGESSAESATPELPPLLEARELLLEGYYERAEESYNALLDDDATRTPASIGLAECWLQTGRYAETRKLLESIEATGKEAARVKLLLAESAAAVGGYDRAIDLANEAIRLDPQLCRARLLLANTLETVGRRDAALEHYEWFNRLATTRLPEDAESLTAAGEGLYRYSVLARHPNLAHRTSHVLNEMYQAAYTQLDRNYWPARVAAADLLREKFNLEEAADDYRAALRVNSNAAAAQIGLGWLALEGWEFEEVQRRVDLALQTIPNDVDALNLLAACRIVERRYEEAQQACDRALAVNPNSIEVLARCAASLLARNETDKAAGYIARAQRVNDHSSALNAIIGEVLSGMRRFSQAEGYIKKAIELDPSASAPRTELGLMYMQWGYEAKARDALDVSWKLDPYNEKTRNTLNLLDRLAAFKTIETEHFIIHYDAPDKIVARRCADYLETVYAPVCADYNATLARKTTIEIFPKHSEFAVRITGQPWIHTVGACTGPVIAIDSPRRGADLQGPYNYASVLEHEFTHTVTLAATHNQIAHWFTEGLAVLQEDLPRSYDWRQLLANAVRRNQLFTLDSLDWGFMRPQSSHDRQLAYAQSEWMCEYLITTYGYDVITRLLSAMAEARPQAAVFEEAIHKSPEELDREFAAWARQQAATWGFDLEPPEDVSWLRAAVALHRSDADLHARLARARWDDDNVEGAAESARAALDIDSKNRLALEVLVRCLHRESLDADSKAAVTARDDRLIETAPRLLEVDPDNRYALKYLADVYVRRKRLGDALPLLVRLKRAWPLDTFAARSLAGIYLKRGDDDQALPELLDVAPSADHDADVPFQIGEILERRGRLQDAQYWYRRVLFIDPMSEPAYAALARIAMRLNDTPEAVRNYVTLCDLVPTDPEHFADAALAYHKLGELDNARKYAARAVELDPHSRAAALLQD